MQSVKLWGLGSLLLITVVGCGGLSTSDSAQVRAVNGMINVSSATITAGATTIMDGGSYDSYTGYVSAGSGNSQEVIVSDSSGQLAEQSFNLSSSSHYTIYATGIKNNTDSTTKPDVFISTDDTSSPSGSNVRFHIVNLSPNVTSIDTYISYNKSLDITTVSPDISSLNFKKDQSGTFSLNGSNDTSYRIWITAAGSTKVIATYTTGSLSAGAIRRIVFLDGNSSGTSHQVLALSDNDVSSNLQSKPVRQRHRTPTASTQHPRTPLG